MGLVKVAYRFPSGTDKRQQFEHQVGQDGWGSTSCSPSQRSIPMPRVWKQNYLPLEDGGTWIADQDRKDGSEVVLFPYDLDAKASKKRSTYWIGYKVHFTPNL